VLKAEKPGQAPPILMDMPLFVRAPESWGGYWLILPTVNAEVVSTALSQYFAEKVVGVGRDKRILIGLYRAG
jgi:hypothetical protein